MGNIKESMLPQILSWKNIYSTVYYISISGKDYFFRTLTREEYLSIFNINVQSLADVEDVILGACLLYPDFSKELFDSKLAGEVDALVQSVLKASGFSETDKLLEDLDKERESLGSLENQMIVLICKAFPHLKLQDINKFTYEDLLRHVAISEAILDVKLNIEKPKPHKEGTIDFDAENREIDPSLSRKNLKTPRG